MSTGRNIVGAVQSRIEADIDAYLEAIASIRNRRGRRRPLRHLDADLAAINRRLEDPHLEPLKRLHLIQHRLDIHQELDRRRPERQLPELERRFIAIAATYAHAIGRPYSSWRQAGVPINVLRRAGIHPTPPPATPTTTPFAVTRLLPRHD